MKVLLLVLFRTIRMPFHPRRKQLAHSIAQSHIYLHSVNWNYQDIRSNSIILLSFSAGDDVFKELMFLSGAEHLEIDRADGKATRHPQTLDGARVRSKKSNDGYSWVLFWSMLSHICLCRR